MTKHSSLLSSSHLLRQPKLVSYLETVPPLLLIKRAHSAFNAFPITQIHTYTHTSHTTGNNTGFPHNRIPKLHEAHTTFPYYSHCSMVIGGREKTKSATLQNTHGKNTHPPTSLSSSDSITTHLVQKKLFVCLCLSVCL
jgi:hypothetical protein